MSKHTPGPWTALEAREDGLVHKSLRPYYYADVCVGPRETHGNSLARVSLGGPGATHNTREAVEANAKLIAAAPELLALCNEMFDWLRPELVKEPERTFFWKLHRAIAKATGEA